MLLLDEIRLLDERILTKFIAMLIRFRNSINTKRISLKNFSDCVLLLFFFSQSLSARSCYNLYNLSHLHRKTLLFVLILHMKRIYSNYHQYRKFDWCWHKDCKTFWLFVFDFESSFRWHSCLSFLSRKLIATEMNLKMIVNFFYLEFTHINSISKSLLELIIMSNNFTVDEKSSHC
jgi:hypothetical protein